ncbi:angiogenic factor with G patch and FHA domains 1 isoform X2 [Lepisosteus oculatus]|uniref:angiogenic factor with G patch and FHA domains 1 isoform X2 n=1 Tax=Lepisosteus oculatus TaxID=7918 RepID=UPI0007403111|nr:PREDICTED: angiogenic factor with G patch and FHA domains 1 isoform X2 [Lepisosteus oculatus]
MAANGEQGSETELSELRQKVETLEEELKSCKTELRKLQKQLNQTERLYKTTESYNDDLRKQVDNLSKEIHDRKKREKNREDAETQTETAYSWTDSDYHYYYGSYYQSGNEAKESNPETPEDLVAELHPNHDTQPAAQHSQENVSEPEKETSISIQESDSTSIADILRATAEEAVSQTGFVFDENSGMYYDHNTGFYYDSTSQLYYDANTGMYYYYDAESGRYQFHSRVEVQAHQQNSEPSQDKKGKKRRKGTEKPSAQDVKVEVLTKSLANMKISSFGRMAASQACEEAWPPCVRVTVVRSPVLQTGTLFIITADKPATIGREKEMEHTIRIPEMGVSKFHAEVYFDLDLQSYVLVDQGSQNGTVINGNRILQPKSKCEPFTLTHGDEIKMGDTVLSFHIHTGNETCDGCEPGQVIAHVSRNKKEEASVLTKEDKEILRQKELKQMKVKYGLKNSEYEGTKALKNSKYKDRAEKRRQTVGSEGAFQRDDAPASVHVEISDGNKGRKMLEKMGWKKGEGLGKDGSGRKDPIQLQIRKSQAGLGIKASLSVEDVALHKSKNQKNWDKARERFSDSCQSSKTSKNKVNPSAKSWLKGEAE